MKSAKTKYEEAVARNLPFFKHSVSYYLGNKEVPGAKDSLKRLANQTVESLKEQIGIRKTDTAFDTELSELLSDLKKKIGHAEKAEKAEKVEAKAEAKADTKPKKPVTKTEKQTKKPAK